jgi:peptide/nickel transport system substrate-binding protein
MDPATDGMAKSVLQIIEQVETPDDQTVVVHLTQPHAEFPMLLMGVETSIIPAGSGDTIGETGIGTGPFRLETLDPTGTTRLVANDDYWQGKPGVAAVEFIGIAESNARLQARLTSYLNCHHKKPNNWQPIPRLLLTSFRAGYGMGMRCEWIPHRLMMCGCVKRCGW